MDNPNNLPLEVALVVEQSVANPSPEKREDAPVLVDDLVTRLLAIRERLFWLHAVWATTLSPDVAYEADRYREVFRDLGELLRKQDPEKLDRIVEGHEALLLAEPMQRPTLPLAAQQWFELAGEVRSERRLPSQPTPHGYVPDGLQQFV